MRLLVIDNYDSFTYNLVHLLTAITQEEPLVVRNDELSWDELKHNRFDAIVLSPGPGRPDRSKDFGLCKDAIEHSTVPLLGVCLGHQGIVALAGGSVVPAPVPMHGRTSLVLHTGEGLFEGIPSPLRVARYHSLMARRPLPPCLKATAWAADGTVMALAHMHRNQWGVQFHPESIITDHGQKLLENFCQLAELKCSQQSGSASSRPALDPPPAPDLTSRRTYWREISREVEAETIFHSLFGASPHAFWLDSNSTEADRTRWSYLGDASGPHAACLEYDCLDGYLRILRNGTVSIENIRILDYLERSMPSRSEAPPCPFVGGYVGWFGYELRHDCGSSIRYHAATPDAMLIYSDRFIAIDHVGQKTYLVAVEDSANTNRAHEWLDATAAAIEATDSNQRPKVPDPTVGFVDFHLDRDKSTYLSDVRHCLELIAQGESYQICLTNEITCSSALDPLALYGVMRKVNPAPYSAFIKWPGGAILSASPERFLSISADGSVETKPIKGTIRRGRNSKDDSVLAEKLRTSEKDRAENVMIVDLLRNDLSRVCAPGSVKVPKLFEIESYKTVHQLVSTVRGRLRPGQTAISAIRQAFPGGSMTGAPKHRTLAIIDEFERRPRGVYSGSIGWLGDDGAADLNIVIRTIVAQQGRLSIGVGGGIVTASTPEDEFEEMLLKAEAMIKSIVIASTGRFDTRSFRLSGAEALSDASIGL